MSKSLIRDAGHTISRPAIHRDRLIADIFVTCAQSIGHWIERRGQRRALAGLEDYRLKDIGVSREQADREARKPFWKR